MAALPTVGSATAFPETVAVAMVDLAMVDEVTEGPAMAGQVTADPAMAAPVTAVPAMAAPVTAVPATAVPATAVLATEGLATADLVTADLAMADLETVGPVSEVPVTADLVPATADPATATADPATATADPATATAVPATEMETVDRSVEQAFFARAMVLSDSPVSFEADVGSEPRDLEGREQRRAHFTRVVGVIVGTLGVGALLALTRSVPSPTEVAPSVVFAAAPHAEVAQIPQEEPTETLPLELTADEPVASTTTAPPSPSTAPAASVERAAKTLSTAPAAKARGTAPAAPPSSVTRVRAAKAPAVTSLVPAHAGNPLPPTARFAD